VLVLCCAVPVLLLDLAWVLAINCFAGSAQPGGAQ
jgi:hypothetical protein